MAGNTDLIHVSKEAVLTEDECEAFVAAAERSLMRARKKQSPSTSLSQQQQQQQQESPSPLLLQQEETTRIVVEDPVAKTRLA
jgi:hypothetical protein